ncbi:MAG: acyl-CoA dehydrogenase family protein [Actinobacteria bacterium]|nr:acyl-CoA dehydrogenase family protein [Actinomycetota bacterium]
MRIEVAPADDPRRLKVREWLNAHPRPSGRDLAEAGYVAPHWPPPWGLAADPIHQLIIDEELREAGVRRPANPIGTGWAGPTLLHAGTPAQQERYLFPMLAGEELWCQLFSEPEAGSDLAALRTTALRDGDDYIVNGQKVWTSLAHTARFGILLARTETDTKGPAGISYFICPMDAPGVDIRPLVEMTGAHTFNEVFLTDVRLGPEHLVGEEGGGWALAKVTLAQERVSLSGEGALWGRGPTHDDLLEAVREGGGLRDAVARDRLVRIWAEGEVLRALRLRALGMRVAGKPAGPESSVAKALADEHGQRLMGLAKDLAGPFGMLAGPGPLGSEDALWHYGFLFSTALTIGGGTSEVQRNIIGERVLGLPR